VFVLANHVLSGLTLIENLAIAISLIVNFFQKHLRVRPLGRFSRARWLKRRGLAFLWFFSCFLVTHERSVMIQSPQTNTLPYNNAFVNIIYDLHVSLSRQ